MYTIDKYFEYCKEGNIEAIYYCIKVKGVNAEQIDEQLKNSGGIRDCDEVKIVEEKDAFYIACENDKPDMLHMLLNLFKVRSD